MKRTAGNIVDETIDLASKAFKGNLHSNKAINPLAKSMLGGPEYIGQVLKTNDFGGSFNKVFREGGTADGKLNVGKIAGSAFTVAAGARIASGGGAYKDGKGNTNIVGVPFV